MALSVVSCQQHGVAAWRISAMKSSSAACGSRRSGINGWRGGMARLKHQQRRMA